MSSVKGGQTIVPPTSHKAVIIEDGDNVRVEGHMSLPALSEDQFLVRTEAVAINPSDTKMRGPFVTSGGVLGTDYAGTVVARGKAVTGVEIGDRICGAQNAMNANSPLRGSFGEYNINAGKVWLKLPPSMSTEGGATLGAGLSTAGLALKLLGLPLPDTPVEKSAYVLVYGGNTATATIAIQLLRLINMIPIAACSDKSSEAVRRIGAEQTFEYRQPECAAKIRTYTKNGLRYALDCITTVESTKICYSAIGRAGGKYVALDPFSPDAATRAIVKADWVLGPSIFGEGSTWPTPYGRPPSEEIRAYGEKLWDVAQKLVDEGKLQHHPVKTLEGVGLEQVIEGIGMVKNGDFSGEKCVVRLK